MEQGLWPLLEPGLGLGIELGTESELKSELRLGIGVVVRAGDRIGATRGLVVGVLEMGLPVAVLQVAVLEMGLPVGVSGGQHSRLQGVPHFTCPKGESV